MNSPPARVSLPGLRAARRRARLTQRQLAQRLGVSPKHIAQLETGNAYAGTRALNSLVSWWAGVARCTPAEAGAYLCCVELLVNGEVFTSRGPWAID